MTAPGARGEIVLPDGRCTEVGPGRHAFPAHRGTDRRYFQPLS